jgi:hypothetical protein
MMTFSVTLTNPDGLRLTLFVQPPIHEQPYDAAERIANASPEHSRYAPWTAGRCERAS